MDLGKAYAAVVAAAERRAVAAGRPSVMEQMDAAYECRHGRMAWERPPCGCFAFEGEQLTICDQRAA